MLNILVIQPLKVLKSMGRAIAILVEYVSSVMTTCSSVRLVNSGRDAPLCSSRCPISPNIGLIISLNMVSICVILKILEKSAITVISPSADSSNTSDSSCSL